MTERFVGGLTVGLFTLTWVVLTEPRVLRKHQIGPCIDSGGNRQTIVVKSNWMDEVNMPGNAGTLGPDSPSITNGRKS